MRRRAVAVRSQASVRRRIGTCLALRCCGTHVHRVLTGLRVVCTARPRGRAPAYPADEAATLESLRYRAKNAPEFFKVAWLGYDAANGVRGQADSPPSFG